MIMIMIIIKLHRQPKTNRTTDERPKWMRIIDSQITKLHKQTNIANNGRNTKANNKWKMNIKAKKKQEVDSTAPKASSTTTARI